MKKLENKKKSKKGESKNNKDNQTHAFKRFCIFKKVRNIHTKVHAQHENGIFEKFFHFETFLRSFQTFVFFFDVIR